MLRSLKYGLYGAVLAGLVAIPVFWLSTDKTVHLVVDGKPTTVSTTASDVGALLRSRGFDVTSHDLVAPATTTALSDGMKIVLRRGRLLHLDVNGDQRSVWTTAPTVQVAMQQLGYSEQDFVSVSRSQRLPLSPTAMTVRTPQSVMLVQHGDRSPVTSTAPTVGSLLAQLGVELKVHDRVRPGADTPLADVHRIRIERVIKHQVVQTQQIDFVTKHRKDSQMMRGETEVSQTGRAGVEKVTYKVVYVDGKRVRRTQVGSVVLRQPKPQIVQVGTEKMSQVLAENSSGTPEANQAIAKVLLARRGWSDQFSCLVDMWDHESGWSVHAANPSGAYGIPQALPGDKMASAGPDWQNNPETQIKWGLDYIAERYGTPCNAWATWQAQGGWY